MNAPLPEPANPLHSNDMPWIQTGAGTWFRPLRFEAESWSELMRIDPGTQVPLHRHTGPVHAFNLAGARRILSSGELVGPGDYVYEPAGMIDGWEAIGDEPCVVHLNIVGAVEYLDQAGDVVAVFDSASQRDLYLRWCREGGTEPATQIIEASTDDTDVAGRGIE